MFANSTLLFGLVYFYLEKVKFLLLKQVSMESSYVIAQSLLSSTDLPQILQLQSTYPLYREYFSDSDSKYILKNRFGIESLDDASGVTQYLRDIARENETPGRYIKDWFSLERRNPWDLWVYFGFMDVTSPFFRAMKGEIPLTPETFSLLTTTPKKPFDNVLTKHTFVDGFGYIHNSSLKDLVKEIANSDEANYSEIAENFRNQGVLLSSVGARRKVIRNFQRTCESRKGFGSGFTKKQLYRAIQKAGITVGEFLDSEDDEPLALPYSSTRKETLEEIYSKFLAKKASWYTVSQHNTFTRRELHLISNASYSDSLEIVTKIPPILPPSSITDLKRFLLKIVRGHIKVQDQEFIIEFWQYFQRDLSSQQVLSNAESDWGIQDPFLLCVLNNIENGKPIIQFVLKNYPEVSDNDNFREGLATFYGGSLYSLKEEYDFNRHIMNDYVMLYFLSENNTSFLYELFDYYIIVSNKGSSYVVISNTLTFEMSEDDITYYVYGKSLIIDRQGDVFEANLDKITLHLDDVAQFADPEIYGENKLANSGVKHEYAAEAFWLGYGDMNIVGSHQVKEFYSSLRIEAKNIFGISNNCTDVRERTLEYLFTVEASFLNIEYSDKKIVFVGVGKTSFYAEIGNNAMKIQKTTYRETSSSFIQEHDIIPENVVLSLEDLKMVCKNVDYKDYLEKYYFDTRAVIMSYYLKELGLLDDESVHLEGIFQISQYEDVVLEKLDKVYP